MQSQKRIDNQVERLEESSFGYIGLSVNFRSCSRKEYNMRGKRFWNQIVFILKNSPYKRADYLRKKNVFAHVGKDVSYQPRKIPLYGQLISIGDNVVIASDVSFLTHDAMYSVFNRVDKKSHVSEKIGCIKLGNNCFIGANSTIMYDVSIGDNCVVAAGAVVTKDVPSGEIVGGVPAKHIGYTTALRDKYVSNPEVHKNKEELSNDTVEELWDAFNNKRG